MLAAAVLKGSKGLPLFSTKQERTQARKVEAVLSILTLALRNMSMKVTSFSVINHPCIRL
jgi:hypothetical protein